MKILIIGIVASGKTTLASRLSKKYNVDYYGIDQIVHDDINNRKRTIDEQKFILNEVIKNKDWIIEGTLRKNLYYLLEKSDKIIYLDIPKYIRINRILKRHLKQKLKLEKSYYKPSITMVRNMLKWTNEYELEEYSIKQMLKKYNKKLVILTSREEIKKYDI